MLFAIILVLLVVAIVVRLLYTSAVSLHNAGEDELMMNYGVMALYSEELDPQADEVGLLIESYGSLEQGE